MIIENLSTGKKRFYIGLDIDKEILTDSDTEYKVTEFIINSSINFDIDMINSILKFSSIRNIQFKYLSSTVSSITIQGKLIDCISFLTFLKLILRVKILYYTLKELFELMYVIKFDLSYTPSDSANYRLIIGESMSIDLFLDLILTKLEKDEAMSILFERCIDITGLSSNDIEEFYNQYEEKKKMNDKKLRFSLKSIDENLLKDITNYVWGKV